MSNPKGRRITIRLTQQEIDDMIMQGTVLFGSDASELCNYMKIKIEQKDGGQLLVGAIDWRIMRQYIAEFLAQKKLLGIVFGNKNKKGD